MFQRNLTSQMGDKLRCTDSGFTVRHYFGDVAYSFGGQEAPGFAQKNRDNTSEDFFSWWQDASRNPLARSLRLLEKGNSYHSAMIIKAITADPTFRTAVGVEVQRVMRKCLPKLEGAWKGKYTCEILSEWNKELKRSQLKAMKHCLGSDFRREFQKLRHADAMGTPTQYVPPPLIRVGSGQDRGQLNVEEVRLAVLESPSKASTVEGRASFRIASDDRGNARVVDVCIENDLTLHYPKATRSGPTTVQRRNVVAQGARDPVTALLGRRLTRLVRKHTAWVYAKHGDMDGIGGLTKKRRSDMTTVDQFKEGVDALFSAIPNDTRPSFIRCINPKRPGVDVPPTTRERFDQLHVLQQLTNCGIVDTVQVRQQGYAYRRDKLAFVEVYHALIPPQFRVFKDDDDDDQIPEEDIIHDAINFLFASVLQADGDSHAYTIGATMVFVKSTDSITALNRLLAADTGASLDEAVLATDKDDTEYCVDLFQAIRNSAHSASPEELDNARKALVLRGKLDSSDYLIIERECSKAHAVQSMDLRGVATYSVPALSIITTTLQRHFSEEVALSSFDMSGSMIPAADGRSEAWEALCKALSMLPVETVELSGLTGVDAKVLATHLLRAGRPAQKSLRKITVNSSGAEKPAAAASQQQLYSLLTASATVRTLDLRGKGLGDADCALLVAWLSRQMARPVAAVSIHGNPIGIDGFELLVACRWRGRPVGVMGVPNPRTLELMRKARQEQRVRSLVSDKASISTCRQERSACSEFPHLLLALDAHITRATQSATETLVRARAGSDIDGIRSTLEAFVEDREFVAEAYGSLERHMREVENAAELEHLRSWALSLPNPGATTGADVTSRAIAACDALRPRLMAFPRQMELLDQVWAASVGHAVRELLAVCGGDDVSLITLADDDATAGRIADIKRKNSDSGLSDLDKVMKLQQAKEALGGMDGGDRTFEVKQKEWKGKKLLPHKKTVGEYVTLSISTMGIKVMDGVNPIEKFRFEDLVSWGCVGTHKFGISIKNPEGGSKPKNINFGTTSTEQGPEISEVMLEMAKKLAEEMKKKKKKKTKKKQGPSAGPPAGAAHVRHCTERYAEHAALSELVGAAKESMVRRAGKMRAQLDVVLRPAADSGGGRSQMPQKSEAELTSLLHNVEKAVEVGLDLRGERDALQRAVGDAIGAALEMDASIASEGAPEGTPVFVDDDVLGRRWATYVRFEHHHCSRIVAAAHFAVRWPGTEPDCASTHTVRFDHGVVKTYVGWDVCLQRGAAQQQAQQVTGLAIEGAGKDYDGVYLLADTPVHPARGWPEYIKASSTSSKNSHRLCRHVEDRCWHIIPATGSKEDWQRTTSSNLPWQYFGTVHLGVWLIYSLLCMCSTGLLSACDSMGELTWPNELTWNELPWNEREPWSLGYQVTELSGIRFTGTCSDYCGMLGRVSSLGTELSPAGDFWEGSQQCSDGPVPASRRMDGEEIDFDMGGVGVVHLDGQSWWVVACECSVAEATTLLRWRLGVGLSVAGLITLTAMFIPLRFISPANVKGHIPIDRMFMCVTDTHVYRLRRLCCFGSASERVWLCRLIISIFFVGLCSSAFSDISRTSSSELVRGWLSELGEGSTTRGMIAIMFPAALILAKIFGPTSRAHLYVEAPNGAVPTVRLSTTARHIPWS